MRRLHQQPRKQLFQIYTFPVYCQPMNEWIIDNEDGTFRTISNSEYQQRCVVDKYKKVIFA